ncbi:MAG: hypothetical protein GC159_08745 [Phycisphaera sp.]|nr:hypothetical protein [Phycisphaera sp.]
MWTTAYRSLTWLVLAVWFGGFTLYAAVVVPIGADVLGSPLDQGFITQRVTHWINGIGLVALALLLGDVWLSRHRAAMGAAMRVTLSVMVVAVAAQIALHPHLDDMLNPAGGHITGRAHFYTAHRVYLLIAAAQWLACLAHVVLMVGRWRRIDALGAFGAG